jgi:hypothetical protein
VDEVYNDDVAYVRDLGLIAADTPARVANPIYREVIVDRRSDLQRRQFLQGVALADARPGVEMSSIRHLRQDRNPHPAIKTPV